MHPAHSFLGSLGMMGFLGSSLSMRPSQTATERQLDRLNKAEQVYLQKINSDAYNLAQAKRERKRQKRINDTAYI